MPLFIDSTVKRLDFQMKCSDGKTHDLYITEMSVKDAGLHSELLKPYISGDSLKLREYNLTRVAVSVKKQKDDGYFFSVEPETVLTQFESFSDSSLAALVKHINEINPVPTEDDNLESKKNN